MALILITDDSSFQRGVIRSLVQKAGYTTEEAVNGIDGLAKITARKPDCILTDLLMPDMGGLELLEELQEQSITIPVIVVTSNSQNSVRDRCMELGAFAIIDKPVSSEELLPVLKRALSRTA